MRKFIDFGFTWVAIASDLGMMVGRAQEWLGKVRGSESAAPTKPSAGY